MTLNHFQDFIFILCHPSEFDIIHVTARIQKRGCRGPRPSWEGGGVPEAYFQEF